MHPLLRLCVQLRRLVFLDDTEQLLLGVRRQVGKNHSPRKVSQVCRSDVKSPPGPTLVITSKASVFSFTSMSLTRRYTWPMISSAITSDCSDVHAPDSM